jgi:two-component sensor histidine kinase
MIYKETYSIIHSPPVCKYYIRTMCSQRLIKSWRFAAIILLTFWSISVPAQEVRLTNSYTLDIEVLGIDQGLSQGMINAMVEDQNGYLWIGTKDGLNRYDGTGIKVFRNDPNNPHSIAENYITSLCVDSKNRLWVGTQHHGVDLYERETGKFIHFRKGAGAINSLRSDMPMRIFLNAEKNVCIWPSDLNLMDVIIESKQNLPNSGKNFTIEHFEDLYPILNEKDNDWTRDKSELIGHAVLQRIFDSEGTFWYNKFDTIFAYTSKAILGKEEPYIFPFEMSDVVLKTNTSKVLFLSADQKDVFLNDGKRTILKYNRIERRFDPFVLLPEGFSFSGQIFIDRHGIIWAEQVIHAKMLKIDPRKREMSILEFKNVSDHNIASSMMRDDNDNIWIPTGGSGVYKISSRREIFKHINFKKSHSKYIWNLRTEVPGNKHHYHNEKITSRWVDHAEANLPKIISERTNSLPQNVAVDNKDNYWFTCRSQPDHYQNCFDYLVKYEISTNKHSIVYKEMQSDLANHFATSIFFDQNGDVWYCNSEEYEHPFLCKFTVETGDIQAFKFPIQTGPLHYRYISDWWVENDNSFWLATIQGVFHFQPENESWEHFEYNEKNEHSLSTNLTLSIYPDPEKPEKFIWIGTEGGGLNKLDRKSGQFTRYTTKDGLPNNVIYGILSDQKNNLWLSTNYGLCLFNPKTLEVRNFTAADGLNGNEFNRHEYSKADDGTLYFGGMEGATYFNPMDLYTTKKPSKVHFTAIKLLNKHVDYNPTSNTDFILPAPIEYCKELRFNYDMRMISLSFTLLDFTVPSQNCYKYMLEGFDKDWIESGNANEATYTNLNPGTYNFKVMGRNSSYVWSAEPATMKIIILPPWWATWWFRTIAIIIFGSLLYGLYRYRMAHLIGLERMRNRIAQDLHDEIGSTLSSISLYSAVMQKSTDNLPPKANDILGKIINSTSEIMEKMNDMVWTIKSDNDDFEQVVNRMRAFAVNMTDAKGINLHFEVGQKTESLKLDMDKRKNIYLILKEAVNNAVKYSRCNNLHVSLTKNGYHLILEIRDDGIGFDLSGNSDSTDLLGGNGIGSMKYRAKMLKADFEISSVLNVGTSIVIAIPLNH